MSELSKSLMKTFGANAFGQIVTIVIQILQMPILLNLYGLNLVGEWLVISAIPTYIALSDVGLSNVAANAVSLAMAEGNVEKARRITHSLCRFIAGLCLLMLVVVAVLSFIYNWAALLKFTILSRGDAAWVVFLLSVGAVAFLGSGLFYGTYRGCGLSARITIIMNSGRLVELVALVGAWLLELNPVAYAGLLLAIRGLFIAYVWWDNKRQCVALPLGFSQGSWPEVRELLRPAFSFMMFPLGNAIYFQGISFVVNATLGAPAVVVYNACRVITRVVPMATMVIRQTLWVEYPALYATGQYDKIRALQRMAAGVTFALIIGMMLVVVPLGPWLIELWTHNNVHLDRSLLCVFLMVAGLNSIWTVNSTLLIAINHHERFSVLYLGCMIGAMILAYFMALTGGFIALGYALLIAELPLCLYATNRACAITNENIADFWGDVVTFSGIHSMVAGFRK